MQLLQQSAQVGFHVLNYPPDNSPSVFRLGSYVFKEDRFFCIPHSTEAAAVKCWCKEIVYKIQATAFARVSETEATVRNKSKVDDSPKEEEKLCIENTIPEPEKETPNAFTVAICWFGLAWNAIVDICK